MDITIGADPELFVKSNSGQLVSAWNLIPGTKANPHPVKHGAVQVDGMALEFNINPADKEATFIRNINHVLEQMRAMIEHDFYISPVAHFGADYIKAQPPEALELGCDPDFNGWTKEVNVKPNVDAPFRTASGHVHIGYGDDSFPLAAAVACQLDYYLGLPSLLVDSDPIRRELYGKAGCFRPKSYGVEYRVLSNFWLLSKDRMAWVFRNAKKAVVDMLENKIYLPRHGDIQHIINENNLALAKEVIREHNLEPCPC